MNSLLNRSSIVMQGLLLGLCCTCACGYVAGNNGWHLRSPFQMKANADLVCKVRIDRVRDVGISTSTLFPGAPEVRRRVAQAQVISVVEGDCPTSIEIEYDFPLGDSPLWSEPVSNLYTQLTEGEVCLVFLDRSKGPYHLGRLSSKARVVPTRVPYTLGDEPLLRLLAEFLAGLTCEDEMVRLQAVEELGWIGDELMKQIGPVDLRGEPSRSTADALKLAQRAIRTSRQSPDVVIRATAIISSFQLADPPTLEEALSILLADPNSLGPDDSRAKYGIRDFSVAQMQGRLLETMDTTTRRAIKDLDTGSTVRGPDDHPLYRGVPGFPYASFFRIALSTEVVAQSEPMRRAIANVIWIRYERASVPEMIRLLDDPESSIRRTGVSALNKCINRNLSNEWDRQTFYESGPSDRKPLDQRSQDYVANEEEYIQYWKAWWAEHAREFDHVHTDMAATNSPDSES